MEPKRNRERKKSSRVTPRAHAATQTRILTILISLIEIVHNGKKFTRKPHIWDFYTSSEEMRDYMTLAIGTMGLVGGWTGEKIISRLL